MFVIINIYKYSCICCYLRTCVFLYFLYLNIVIFRYEGMKVYRYFKIFLNCEIFGYWLLYWIVC